MNLAEKEENEEKGEERVMKDYPLISSEDSAEEHGDNTKLLDSKKEELSDGIEENCRKDEEKKDEIVSKPKKKPRKKSPPGRVLEGRVVTITQDKEAQIIYFIREQGVLGIGGEDIFLHSSRIQGYLPLHSRVRVMVKISKHGPEAQWAEILETPGLKNIVPLVRLKPGWKKGNIVSNGEDKSNNIIYFVRVQSEADNEDNEAEEKNLFLHSRHLPYTDQTFKLQYGTEIYFKERERQTEDCKEIGDVEIIKRVYYLEELFSSMEEKVEKCRREVEITPVLLSTPAWEFIGSRLKVENMRRFICLQSRLFSMCLISTKLLRQILEVSCSPWIFNPRSGIVKMYIEGLEKDEERVEIFEYFLELMKHVPQISSSIIQLIQVFTRQEVESPLVSVYYQMLKNITRNYMKQLQIQTTCFLDYSQLPLLPTQEEIFSQTNIMFQSNLSPVRPFSPYPDEEDYMEVYFRLQRTDGFNAIIKGIKDFNEGKLDHRDMNVYEQVYLRGIVTQQNGYAFVLQVKSMRKVKDLSKTKFLLTGNLLCLSIQGDFSDPIWAKVFNRDDKRLKDGLIFVDILPGLNKKSTSDILLDILQNNGRIIMVESPNFYKAYGPVLAALQSYNMQDLPIKDTVVRCENSGPPLNLESNRIILDPFIEPGTNDTSGEPSVSPDDLELVNTSSDSESDSYDNSSQASSQPEAVASTVRSIFGRNPPAKPISSLPKLKRSNIPFISANNLKLKELRENKETERVQIDVRKKGREIISFRGRDGKKDQAERETINHVPVQAEMVSVDAFLDILEADNKLDPSQTKALQHVLKNRVSIIQGPPGAGKTFIGTKILEILLRLEKPSTRPILVITYKNHALDEFLGGLLDTHAVSIWNMVRIGGKCSDHRLENCRLYNVLRRKEYVGRHHIYELKDQIADLNSRLHQEISRFPVGLKLADIVFYMSDIDIYNILTDSNTNNDMIRIIQRNIWLSGATMQDMILENPSDNLLSDEWRKIKKKFWNWIPSNIDFSRFANSIGKMKQSLIKIQLIRETQKNIEEDNVEQQDQTEVKEWDNERKHYSDDSGRGGPAGDFNMNITEIHQTGFICKLDSFPDTCPLDKDLLSGEIPVECMLTDEKIKYLYAVLCQRQEQGRMNLEALYDEIDETQKKKESFEMANKAESLSDMKVIAMTITGASINNSLLKMIDPEIVMVEEAAEILEPQLLVALTAKLKHLIMIGDHNQLPPQVETYELKNKFNFDVSMMQRLVQNNLPYIQLEMQNRMRPDIAELLKDIYPNLLSNHGRVDSIALPITLTHSSIFWTHKEQEKGDRSANNPAEAEMALSLATLLVTFGAEPRDITILCAYLGQTSLVRIRMQSYLSKYKVLNNTPFIISTVDNYQGDENKIVIVSLVRGNPKGTVGFLKDLPRRCVAQSRAKSCVIFIGNELTIRKAKCWDALMDKVQHLGPQVYISCPLHPVNQLSLDSLPKIQNLLETPSELCSVLCGNLHLCLNKDHACKLPCQPRHEHTKCQTKVGYVCPDCGRDVTKRCYVKDPQCREVIDFEYPRCGHPDKRACYRGVEEEERLKCKLPCVETMSCGKHNCVEKCGETHSHDKCSKMVDTQFSCGHAGKKKCCTADSQVKCRKEILKQFPTCSHSVKVECSESMRVIKCKTEVKFTPQCGHPNVKICYQSALDVKCMKVCSKILLCNHKCEGRCGEDVCGSCVRCKELAKQQIKKSREHARKEVKKIENMLKHRRNPQPTSQFVEPLHDEFDGIKDLTLKYTVPVHNWFPIIEKVERVENLPLQKAWWEAKSELFDPVRDWSYKFHGTDNNATHNICFGSGFRLPEKSKHNMFGQGVYFASNSSKSAQEIYTKKSNKLLVCKVLLGKSLAATTAMNGLTPEEMKKMGYDSLYAAAGTCGLKNDEFIVYNPALALPAYIVHYRNGSPGENSSLPTFKSIPAQQIFKISTVFPKKAYNDKNPYEIQYLLAETVFYRIPSTSMFTKPNIQCIDIVMNPTLDAKFVTMKRVLKCEETQLFYRFKLDDLQDVLKTNFKTTHLKTLVGEKGLYFADRPEASDQYKPGCKSVLLCKVLLAGTKKLSTGYMLPGNLSSLSDRVLPAFVINFTGDL